MSAKTMDLSESDLNLSVEKVEKVGGNNQLPKDLGKMFKLQFLLFIALERLISYFSFIYSVI